MKLWNINMFNVYERRNEHIKKGSKKKKIFFSVQLFLDKIIFKSFLLRIVCFVPAGINVGATVCERFSWSVCRWKVLLTVDFWNCWLLMSKKSVIITCIYFGNCMEKLFFIQTETTYLWFQWIVFNSRHHTQLFFKKSFN